ncbi:MAG: type II toxin-antitoxin system VapC family toxin [Firmicutes bacterium]|nr:type II toxin-antitoxin system VapC family toxin [Bacillota bacterium]
MAYLIDTCILIDHLRGYGPARDWLVSSIAGSPDDVFISVITLTELLAGVTFRQEKPLRNLVSVMKCLAIEEPVARAAGEYLRKWRPALGLDVPDALIAATAKQYGLTLATLNRRYFPMEDLSVIIPYKYS